MSYRLAAKALGVIGGGMAKAPLRHHAFAVAESPMTGGTENDESLATTVEHGAGKGKGKFSG